MSPPTVKSSSAFFASAALIARSAWSISSRERFIHSSPSFARGTIISRLPDSANATAWLRAAVHSSFDLGRISCVPSRSTMVRTASQSSSALGSTTACISSLVSATGLYGGGGGVLLQPEHRRTDHRGTETQSNRFPLLLGGFVPLGLVDS